MSNAFQRYKDRCHAHYQKFSTTTEARQNPFQAMPPNEWEKICDLFEDSTYQVISLLSFFNMIDVLNIKL